MGRLLNWLQSLICLVAIWQKADGKVAPDLSRHFRPLGCCSAKRCLSPIPPALNPCCNRIVALVLRPEADNATTQFHSGNCGFHGVVAGSARPIGADANQSQDCKALGLAIPEDLRATADEVIE